MTNGLAQYARIDRSTGQKWIMLDLILQVDKTYGSLILTSRFWAFVFF